MHELRSQFVSALLVILTVAAASCALINFQQQSRYHQPDDGVTWSERPAGVTAVSVASQGPADRLGIRKGDIVTGINGQRIAKAGQVAEILNEIGAWSPALYTIRRQGVEFPAKLIVGEYTPDSSTFYQYAVGLAYLLIGLFVYYRRANAPHAAHFYILCLASFVLSCFHYTGKLNGFDQVIYAGNVLAGILAPALFLHFCVAFSERLRPSKGFWIAAAIYLPSLFLLALYALISQGMLKIALPSTDVMWLLDRLWMSYLSLYYLSGAAVLSWKYSKADDVTTRLQLKYLRNGTVIGVLPFTVLYVIPYALGAIPGHYQKMAVLSLAFIPITWAYAILRYRLMDVDIIFQQGYVYTLATLCVLGVFYGLIFSFTKPGDLGPAAIVCLILFATFIFQPIREWLQEQMDRHLFYKDRYDPRRSLIEFARELGAETNRDAMLDALGSRLVGALGLQHVVFFLANEDRPGFHLHAAVAGKTGPGRKDHRHAASGDPLDLSFLAEDPDRPYYFFESTRRLVDMVWKELPPSVRRTVADLDLTYYFACASRGRTLGYLGISRTEKGDFLTRDDVDLLTTLSGYVGIALENGRLYQSLQHKAEEYERLKEFSENIVESINVGILAADLDDRIESWNPQIERLTGVSRAAALGRSLREIFPAELCSQFERVRSDRGIHNIYKFALGPVHAGASPNGNGVENGNGHASHREAILNIAVAPLVSKDGRHIGRLIIFDDITDRDELERRLVQADKLSSIGLLAAGVAHEVNTPLAVISTYAQILAKQISGDEKQSRLLEKISRQTFRASEIVNSLLNFSRTSTTEFVEVDLNRVIRETVNLIEHQLQKSGVRVEADLEEDLLPVKGNAGKLQQVFLNLFLNARDAMEGGGRLSVRTWCEDSGVHVEIVDSGQGIARENLARIYDPFFTTKAARKGTGLGLSVTYGIVREHGGTIEVESEPGAGTRFQLALPAARKLSKGFALEIPAGFEE